MLGFALVANAAWLVPALTRPGGVPADPGGVPAFAARADTPLGLAGSLLTLGGIWNPAAWPAGRDSALALVALAAVLAALALGLRPLLARTGPGPAVAAAAALLLAAAGAVPLLDDVLTAVVVHVPGGGLLRDGQKLLAPAVLLVALCAGEAVGMLAANRRTVPYAVLLGVLPVLALPGLGWGVGGRLGAADYPPSWSAVRAAVAAAPPGEVAALPWGLYRRLGFAGDRVVLDPLPRLLGCRVLVDDDLALSISRGTAGEDPGAAGSGLCRPPVDRCRSCCGRPASGTPRALAASRAPWRGRRPGGLAGPLETRSGAVDLSGEVAAPIAEPALGGRLGLGCCRRGLGAVAAMVRAGRGAGLLRSGENGNVTRGNRSVRRAETWQGRAGPILIPTCSPRSIGARAGGRRVGRAWSSPRPIPARRPCRSP